jgi:hypothetical protein
MVAVSSKPRLLRGLLEDCPPVSSTGVVARCMPPALALTPLSGRFRMSSASASHPVMTPLASGQAILGLGIALLG